MNSPRFKALVIILLAGLGFFFIWTQPWTSSRPVNGFFVAAGIACVLQALWLLWRDFGHHLRGHK